jgi:hypothetical protein
MNRHEPGSTRLDRARGMMPLWPKRVWRSRNRSTV